MSRPDPDLSDTPLFDDLAAETGVDHTGLLDGLPPAGPIDPEREIPLFDVALPTLGDGEEGSCHGCGDTPHYLSTGGYCDGCVADGEEES